MICQPVTTKEMTSDQAPTVGPRGQGTHARLKGVAQDVINDHQNSDEQPRQVIVRRAVDGTVQRDSR